MDKKDVAQFILALVGALAWLPYIFAKIARQKIKGKIVSRYFNRSTSQSLSFFVYKLSLYFSKDIEVRNIKCILTDSAGNAFKSNVWNPRFVSFNIDGKQKTLAIESKDLLNNCVHFDKNKAYSGYLHFQFNGNMDFKPESTQFDFESFEGKVYSLKLLESKMKDADLFHDDSIWRS